MNPHKEQLRNYIINHFLFDVSFKPILEDDNQFGELYEENKITSQDFHEILDEYKEVLRNHEKERNVS